MTVHAHVASHPDALVAELCGLLAEPPADPFAAEVVAVPTRGIERWITQRIASGLGERGAGDGVCANVRFPTPRRLIAGVLSSVPGLAAPAAVWEGPALVDHVLATIDSHIDEPWLAVLRRHLADGGGGTRLTAARKIARSFTRYARRRPGMIRAWAAGVDVDPSGAELTATHQWQPALWRRLRQLIDLPSLPELFPAGLDLLRRGPLDLPDRLSVYGLTATDPFDLEVLAALGGSRDVHLFVLHPSPALWKRVADLPAREPRYDDVTADLAAHPLLGSWADESRQLQLVLSSRDIGGSAGDEGAGVHDGSAAPPIRSVLSALQDDIRHNRPPTTGVAVDRSVQIHVCHGSRRQVEVLRDALLHALTDDPTLEPRDIVIMTPDLAGFAPLLEAVFPTGAAAAVGGIPDMRLRIADRSPAATNPLVRFTAAVMDLAGSRLEAGAIRELVTRPVVQRRFGFDDDAAGEIVRLIDDTNVSWGLDGAHRAAWGVPSTAQTWDRALDRALAGVFHSDSRTRTVGGISPLTGMEGQDTHHAGHLVAIVDRMAAIRRLLAGDARTMSAWPSAIGASVRMLAAPAWGDEWQWTELDHLLDGTFTRPGRGADPPLTLADAAAAVAEWAEDRPSPLHFQTGDVTVCTLAPMRSVPYRVVCLLGMDDDRFPRGNASDGDDLLEHHKEVGDTDRGSEDRQLLLDAVMAAGDRLIVTYSGRDELTNAPLPPAVPVAELEGLLTDMTGRSPATIHPMQSFSRDNFAPGRLGVPGPWSFDARSCDGARALANVRDRGGDAAEPVWPSFETQPVVDLDDLIDFLVHPARRFVRDRLRFSIPEPGEVPDDTLTTEIDALERWGVKQRLLDGLVAGDDMETLISHERGTDALPPGDLATEDLEQAAEAAVELWSAARARGYEPARHVRLSGLVAVGGREVDGTVDVDPEAAHLLTVTPSTLRAVPRLKAFTQLVFATAVDPGRPWTSTLIGRSDRSSGHIAVVFGPLGADAPGRAAVSAKALSWYLDLYDRGHLAPLPLPCQTGFAWQRGLQEGRDTAFQAAMVAWETHRFSPEGRDTAWQLVFPHLTSTADLIASGFEFHCRRLWEPALKFMRQEKP